MSDVKLSAPDARRIASGLQDKLDLMSQASTRMTRIVEDLSANGMQGEAGRAFAAKQFELHQSAEKLANLARDRAAGLNDYANVVEAGQAEDAARIGNVG
ncbi:hypothetical protein GS896_25350 [Rhodococcus hoagii]|nr:hypothetical protein [Prescottella equi]MBM4574689.1 hypothetical protein [Prescottella equi]MBM4574901.1 hypothetical protein [Prescottella equi]MBM4654169.1 hypothetical protein [Prescottella equi]MBM4719641.1 hypothetical protein [Prescottella equi]